MFSNNDKGHDARAIANIFVERFRKDNKQLTITQLVKLVYIAHGWTLGYTSEPLICNKIEAWKYGPVVPLVYKTFRPQGVIIRAEAKKRNGEPFSVTTDLTDSEKQIIDGVYKNYSVLSVLELSDITHRIGTPWHQFYNGMFYRTITNDAIRLYYEECVKRLEKKHN